MYVLTNASSAERRISSFEGIRPGDRVRQTVAMITLKPSEDNSQFTINMVQYSSV
ncbi:hypothetical protein [Scytonema hofmannii]|uniref:hypothetical protein n=1 Tax=Scytonema hofmannii TaxID=34078 RepID=UPI00034675E1|nr:hypothetical protein [Scytonema hofmannii]